MNIYVYQRDDVVAVVVECPWQRPTGDFEAALRARHEQEDVSGRLRMERCALFFPVRDELVKRLGLQDIAREDMEPDFGALLHHTHAQILTAHCTKLLDTDGCRQARRAGAHYDDVILHRLTRLYATAAQTTERQGTCNPALERSSRPPV